MPICLSVVVAIVLLGVFVPSCAPTRGTIEVKATLCGVPWEGAVNHTLTGPGAEAAPIDGTEVAHSFTVDVGSWTCAYVAAGPAGAFLLDIKPSDTQTVSAGDTITFTLNFVTPPMQVDASVVFDTWTINGTPVDPGWYLVGPNTIIDARYKEHVSGEEAAEVTVDQTAWLTVHNMGYEGEPGPTITLHCVNAWGAVKMSPPADKLYQRCTVEGVPVSPCTNIKLYYCEPVKLDVEVGWELVVCTNYTKTINWIGIPSPEDILFDVLDPYDGVTFNFTGKACIDVGEGFEDIDPANDCTAWCPPLIITYLSVPP